MSRHRVENDIDTFPSRKLGGRDKIGVGCNQDDLIDLFLIRHRRDVEAETAYRPPSG